MASQNFIEFSKPFVDAARNVFETMVFTKLNTQKPYIKSDQKSQGDISAVIGLNGTIGKEKSPYRAQLVISWPYETYVKIASAMLMEEHDSYSDEIADVGGEISNMIMGNAKRVLAEQGYGCSMAIPSLVEGKDHTINYPPKSVIIVIPIECDHGPMFMEICYAD